MTKIKKRTKVILTIFVIGILVTVLLLFGFSAYIYQSNFGGRFESSGTPNISEFAGLHRERYTFSSNHGQNLVGYKYFKDDKTAKGVIVLAHGFGGGGHANYMDTADYFASNGYVVFAYDATGNDESEGKGVGGMPQGVIDLDYALKFVKGSPDFEGFPIMLFGHSWGAYSAGSVLNLHPDIKAVVMGAGFNKSTDMIEEEGRRQAGAGVDMVLPFMSLIEKVKFGKYATYTCTGGLDSSDAAVMIIHSADDEMVSFEKQFIMFSDRYKNNPRFVFVRYEDRRHNGLFELDEQGKGLMEQIVSFYDSYAK